MVLESSFKIINTIINILKYNIYERVWIALHSLTTVHSVPLRSQYLDIVLFSVLFVGLRAEMVVNFVDISGVVVHHCLNFPFLI